MDRINNLKSPSESHVDGERKDKMENIVDLNFSEWMRLGEAWKEIKSEVG